MQLQMELTQKQTINHQMLQSIQILQMSSTELEHYLEELALENPVIELESRIGQSEDELSYTRQFMLEKASEWLISTDRQNRSFYEDDAETGVEFWRDSRERGTSLDEHLHSQILTGAYTDTQRAILDFLIESLDSHGFLTEDAHSTALLFSVPESVADGMIRELQSLDPPGVRRVRFDGMSPLADRAYGKKRLSSRGYSRRKNAAYHLLSSR